MTRTTFALASWVVAAGLGAGRAQAPPKKYAEYPEDCRRVLQQLDREAESVGKLDSDEFRKAALDFAQGGAGTSGMNLSPAEAKKFADRLAKLAVPKRSLVLTAYKFAYRYAFGRVDQGGLHLSADEARTLADLLAQQPEALQAIVHHQLAFKYGSANYDRAGLGLGKTEAIRFASQVADQKNGIGVLNSHRKAYEHARSSLAQGGLNMSPSGARMHADEKAGLTKK